MGEMNFCGLIVNVECYWLGNIEFVDILGIFCSFDVEIIWLVLVVLVDNEFVLLVV